MIFPSARSSTPYGLQLALLLAGLVVFGVVARSVGYDEPTHFTFDEHHFVENARNYLAGKPDWNDHPPLGKLLIALGILSRGDSPTGFRLASLVLGLGSIVLVGALAGRLYGTRTAAWLGAGLAALDGFLITYSKTALLDGQLAFFSLAAVFVAVGARSWGGWLAAGVLAGLATGVKMSGVAAIATVLVAGALGRGGLQRSLGLVPLGALATYVAQWLLGRQVLGLSLNPLIAFEETARLFRHHIVLTGMTNPSTSSWTTWFLPQHPLILTRSGSEDALRVLSSMGNPLLWITVSLLAFGAIACTLWFGLARTLRVRSEGSTETDATSPRAASKPAAGTSELFTWVQSFWAEHGRASLVPLCGWLAFLAPWILTRRDSYIYHYLPAYVFGIVLVAGALDFLRRTRPLTVLTALCILCIVSLFYAPVWTRAPLTEQGMRARLFLPGWR